MGLSEKQQVVDVGYDSAETNKKWVIAGIPIRSPLKPIFTMDPDETERDDDDGGEEECSTTPTGEEARIPTTFTCPPPPRKQKPTLRCNYGVGRREFFTPPDLETVFIRRHIEKAS
ncbi:hypothetical protein FNV43_RR25939 [Rhamnella rubrinervis]|uniref:Cyclin-dependent protein kinase inhibitor SMR6 n=1 Tax=Rhamnella rubrinervis TaxID=2594499 RepID=A0A8K0DNC2_9ROSA|nr:hypothetical protein FNV43_RR25939 [Rhamnella rubrinervis]